MEPVGNEHLVSNGQIHELSGGDSRVSEHMQGPDQILECEAYSTSEADECVRLRVEESGVASRAPISIPGMFKRTVDKWPDHLALAVKRNEKWQGWTYKEYYVQVQTVAKAFISLGLERFHGVCIMGFNSPEWFIAEVAGVFAGGLSAGIYTTNSPEACLHCINNCKANIIVVENKKQLDKVLAIRGDAPSIKAIIQYEGTTDVPGVLNWNELLEEGKKSDDNELNKRLQAMAVNQACNVIYTLADIYSAICGAATIYFARPDALKGTLGVTLKEVRPTFFFGVPRVWEKMYEKMQEVGRTITGVKKFLATWAKASALSYHQATMRGEAQPTLSYKLAQRLILSKIHTQLGLDRAKLLITAAAPTSQEIHEYFQSIDLPLCEGYGMSESTGPHTRCTTETMTPGSAGRLLPGLFNKIADPDGDGNGEVCMKGRHVFMGYLNNKEETERVLDEDGFLHSGDVGKVDKLNNLYITGRIKELIITAGGENIPPVLIEDAVKAELPVVSNCMLIGDKRKFLSMLLTLRTVVNLDTGEPEDTLSPVAVEWCESIGAKVTALSQILNQPNEKVMEAIQAGIDRANNHATSNAQRVQKWTILTKDFSIPGEELGPTMKVKRPVVLKKYADIIDKFYQDC